ncbi:siroheme synthase [Deinococcus xinjiangensis]|uniref:precorrin-2 dehydrogenase n=2 Tax=Deinococcus xinjiangensis TaxID=457454 RepID=A0ABP9VEX4_9DEIO
MLRRMSLFALLELSGECALIVGGGKVALRRAQTLLEAGLEVTVVAPEVQPALEKLKVTICQRPYQSGDLAGKRLVVLATNHAELNDQICAEAKAAGLLVNHAGAAQQGNLRFAAVTERAGVQVAVSTGQSLPMLAQALAQRIEELLPSAAQLQGWQTARAEALAQTGQERETALHALRQDIQRSLWGAA